MSARPLAGRALAARIQAATRAAAAAFLKERGRAPRLLVLAADHSAAEASYTKVRLQAAREAGIEADFSGLPPGASQAAAAVRGLSADPGIDAIVLDLPLPPPLDARRLFDELAPEKDAEGLTPANYGRLFLAKDLGAATAGPLPCTSWAVIELLRASRAPLSGKRAVVIGRSSIVGRPAAHLLSCMDLTVTLCHSRTRGLEALVREADVVVACVGKPGLVRGAWVKKGAVVVDCGVNSVGGRLAGDVDAEGAARRAGLLTPVPGGVGPVTAALLLRQVLTLARRRAKSAS